MANNAKPNVAKRSSTSCIATVTNLMLRRQRCHLCFMIIIFGVEMVDDLSQLGDFLGHLVVQVRVLRHFEWLGDR